MHAYLAKTRVEQAEMNSLVGTGDLNFKKKELLASKIFSLSKDPRFEIEFLPSLNHISRIQKQCSLSQFLRTLMSPPPRFYCPHPPAPAPA